MLGGINSGKGQSYNKVVRYTDRIDEADKPTPESLTNK